MFNRKKYMKEWRIKNRERITEYSKQWGKDNLERIKEDKKRWARDNPEKIKKAAEKWRKNNPGFPKQYMKYRRKTDKRFNLNHRSGYVIYKSIRKNKSSKLWKTFFNYTLNDLIKHLKKTIPIGYIWQDYLDGKLHIDHIIPIDAFNFTKPEHTDFKRCWSLDNLRLLPAKENLIKHNKLNKPFQPALRLLI